MVGVVKMIDFRDARRLYHLSKPDFALWNVSFWVTVLVGPMEGIAVSVCVRWGCRALGLKHQASGVRCLAYVFISNLESICGCPNLEYIGYEVLIFTKILLDVP